MPLSTLKKISAFYFTWLALLAWQPCLAQVPVTSQPEFKRITHSTFVFPYCEQGVSLYFFQGEPSQPRSTQPLTLKLFKELPKLDSIHGLGFSPKLGFNDEWLEIVIQYKQLKCLIVHDAKLTEKGLSALAALELKKISLHNCPELNEKCVAAIAKIKSLRAVALCSKDLTSDDIVPLKQLSLHSLSLSGCTAMGDRALVTAADFPDLQELSLADVPLTDEGIKAIKDCRKLTRLDLSNTSETGSELTDAIIPILEGFTQLEYLKMDESKITPSGYERLRKSLPKCKIYY